eukprot:NODE_1727_length_755_cov_76.797771_g1678_i0.p1 GENE.NODE_1727_length_755_cov_76.797771_g1678_i0~~NODE_1727_length_755_cov_76.797771_g1678_i0.p1  ORF type:complete len:200 (-),score=78.30 NODE_1727_length_755_cov_76.797771_g1678_i0:71-670(-)
MPPMPPMAAEAEKDPEVTIEEDDEEDDVPELEQVDQGAAAAGGMPGGPRGAGRVSRNEKKNRKAMARLGLKPVAGVERVTIKKDKSIMFVIAQPDTYKSPSSDTYVIFGEASIEDMEREQQEQALRSMKPAESAAPAAAAGAAKPEAAAGDEEEVDASGVEEKDIDLVMTQAGVSRAAAVKALKANDCDIVGAIMELTS